MNEIVIGYDEQYWIDIQEGIGLDYGDLLIMFPDRITRRTRGNVTRYLVVSQTGHQFAQDLMDVQASVDPDLEWDAVEAIKGQDSWEMGQVLEQME